MRLVVLVDIEQLDSSLVEEKSEERTKKEIFSSLGDSGRHLLREKEVRLEKQVDPWIRKALIVGEVHLSVGGAGTLETVSRDLDKFRCKCRVRARRVGPAPADGNTTPSLRHLQEARVRRF